MQIEIKLGESERQKLVTKIRNLSEKITQFDEDAKIKTVQLENMQVDKAKSDTQIQNLSAQLKVMQEDKNKLGTQLQDLLNNKENSDHQIQGIKNENDNLKKDIAQLKCRMDKIDLRDTLKMSFKYLYKILRSHFKEMKEVNNYWDEIREIKKILKRKEFSEFVILNKFISDIEYTDLNPLNSMTHFSASKIEK